LAEKLSSANGDNYSEAWNFGPNENDAKPVAWVINELVDQWGEHASWVLDKNIMPHEASYLKLDCSKALCSLGWKPKLNLETAINWLVDWHKCHIRNNNLRDKTIEQITKYQDLLPL
jgi:CDP-glucose 4,6-dehydratase